MESVIFSFGVLLFLLGLIGRVEAREIKVGTDRVPARIVAALVGICLTLLALGHNGYLPSLGSSSEEAFSWEGTWNTNWGESLNLSDPNSVVVEFTSEGDGAYLGRYRYLDNATQKEISGSLKGESQGSRLLGGWEEQGPDGSFRGSFEFAAFPEDDTFLGKYFDSATPDRPLLWKGRKATERP